jgi:hypothetical protein
MAVAPPRVSQTLAFRCGVKTPSIPATPLHSKSSAQPASFDRSLIIVLAPPKNQILKIQILDKTWYVPGLLVLTNQSPMKLNPPERFLFSPKHLLRNGADNRSGRSTWSATCLISNLLIKPRNLDILTDSGLKAVGRLSLTPTKLKHGTDVKKP